MGSGMLLRREEQNRRIATWNIRWLVSPHTEQATAKRGVVRQWLDAGHVSLLQETHWDQADIAIWTTPFPAATLAAAPAVPGPRGGPCGGVATLLPCGFTLLQSDIVVPGRV